MTINEGQLVWEGHGALWDRFPSYPQFLVSAEGNNVSSTDMENTCIFITLAGVKYVMHHMTVSPENVN